MTSLSAADAKVRCTTLFATEVDEEDFILGSKARESKDRAENIVALVFFVVCVRACVCFETWLLLLE